MAVELACATMEHHFPFNHNNRSVELLSCYLIVTFVVLEPGGTGTMYSNKGGHSATEIRVNSTGACVRALDWQPCDIANACIMIYDNGCYYGVAAVAETRTRATRAQHGFVVVSRDVEQFLRNEKKALVEDGESVHGPNWRASLEWTLTPPCAVQQMAGYASSALWSGAGKQVGGS
jgi:hypothetical protein